MSVASRVGMLAVRSWRFQSVKSDISGGLGAVFSFQCQVFSKNLDGDGMGNLGWLAGNRGAHGVTRPTTRGLARRWMIVGAYMDVSSCKKKPVATRPASSGWR